MRIRILGRHIDDRLQVGGQTERFRSRRDAAEHDIGRVVRRIRKPSAGGRSRRVPVRSVVEVEDEVRAVFRQDAHRKALEFCIAESGARRIPGDGMLARLEHGVKIADKVFFRELELLHPLASGEELHARACASHGEVYVHHAAPRPTLTDYHVLDGRRRTVRERGRARQHCSTEQNVSTCHVMSPFVT